MKFEASCFEYNIQMDRQMRMSVQYLFNLSDQQPTSIKRFHLKSYLCFLSNLRVKLPITKMIEDNIFVGTTYRFYIL